MRILDKLTSPGVLLSLIVINAFILRIIFLDKTPPSLNWDEVSHGYNAYSILKTGRDEWGKSFPLIFRAYGDYKLPVYIYAVAVSEFFIGPSELAVRLPSALAGTFSVFFVYLFTYELYKNKKVALFSGVLVAIEPWGLFLSRIAVEANLALMFIISGAYFYIRGVRLRSSSILIGISLLGISAWTYNSARIFSPLFLFGLSFIYQKEAKEFIKRRPANLVLSILLICGLFLTMFWQLTASSGLARYANVQIINDGAISRIVESRNTSELPGVLPRVVYNKGTFFVNEYVRNYISHFSPTFLYLKGGSHYQFNIPNFGLLYLVNAPFLLIGILHLIKNRNVSSKVLLLWIIIAPIAASFTRESPHALRSILIIPIPMILSAQGIIVSWESLKNKQNRMIFMLLYLVLLSISAYSFLIRYLDYKDKYSWAWQYGNKEMVDYVRENYNNYDKIIISKKYGEPHEFLLFYWPWRPDVYQNDQKLIRFYQSNWYWVDQFDKFYFVNDWDIPNDSSMLTLESGKEVDCTIGKCLLVSSPEKNLHGWDKVYSINFLDGSRAFDIYEN